MHLPHRARRLYTLKERLQLKPATDQLKLARNALISGWYTRQIPEGFGEELRGLGDLHDKPVLFTIAFNLPWAIDLLIRSTRVHMPEWNLVVLDNSNKPEMRVEIRAICERLGVPYVALPKNPERSPNRSHGIALNWAWRNIIRPKQPKYFGLLDHDCFPFAPTPACSRIARQAVDGLRIKPRFVEGAWYIWAGYCFFNTSMIGRRDLDFNHDQGMRLDTAGRNWSKLYRHLDVSGHDFIVSHKLMLPACEGTGEFGYTQIGDTLLHIGGGSYRTGEENERRNRTAREFIEASLIENGRS